MSVQSRAGSLRVASSLTMSFVLVAVTLFVVVAV